jgi:mono/diheme cytochrome c family protein
MKGGFAFLSILAVLTLPAAAQTADFRGASFAMQGGEAVYRGICQGCHMPDAKGATGAGSYPGLSKNPHLAEAGYVITMVLNGHKGMPPFRGHLTDQQIADVVNYVRRNFGNRFRGEVKPDDVKALR